MKTFRVFQHRSELMLLPPSLKDWVPASQVVHFIADVVEHLDLRAIMAAYDDPHGNPPYHPKVMVGILLYAYARGVRGSRRIERMCYEDVPMRMLAGNVQPDHWTISNFRRRHLEALGELFAQTVHLAQKAGLLKMGHLSIDGTKLKANASKHSAMSYGRMKQERDRLQEQILKELREAVAGDEREEAELGDRSGEELPPELAHAGKRLAAIKQAMAALEAEALAAAQQKVDASEQRARRQAPAKPKSKAQKGRGGTPTPASLIPEETERPVTEPGEAGVAAPHTTVNPGAASTPKVVPADKAQYNFTDPESRIMRTSSKAFDQCYNAQAAVDSTFQIIAAADLTNQAADAPHLRPMVDQAIQNTGSTPAEVSADAGYFHALRIEALTTELQIDAFIPPEKIRHSEWRAQTPLEGPPPQELDTKGHMRWKLRTKNGRERYQLRQQTVEPVFGQIKWNRGLHQLLLRGLAAARASWRFECAVHNLLKLHTAGLGLA